MFQTFLNKTTEEASPPNLASGAGGEMGRFRIAAPRGSRRFVRGGGGEALRFQVANF